MHTAECTSVMVTHRPVLLGEDVGQDDVVHGILGHQVVLGVPGEGPLQSLKLSSLNCASEVNVLISSVSIHSRKRK